MPGLNFLKKMICVFIVFIIQSCQFEKQMNSSISIMSKKMIGLDVAMTHFISEAALRIYEIDTLPEKTEAVIKKIDIAFYGDKDSLLLNLKDVKFYFVNDTLHYDNMVLPKYRFNNYSDSLKCNIDCYFITPKHSEIRCLMASYKIVNTNISIQNPFTFCSK